MAFSHYEHKTGTFTFPDSSGIANGAGTVSHSHVTNITTVTGSGTAFETVFEVNQYILIGAIIRKVKHIYSNTRLEVYTPFTTTAAGVNFKVIPPMPLYSKVAITVYSDVVTVSTPYSDNQTLAIGDGSTTGEYSWDNVRGVEPMYFNASGNVAISATSQQ